MIIWLLFLVGFTESLTSSYRTTAKHQLMTHLTPGTCKIDESLVCDVESYAPSLNGFPSDIDGKWTLRYSNRSPQTIKSPLFTLVKVMQNIDSSAGRLENVLDFNGPLGHCTITLGHTLTVQGVSRPAMIRIDLETLSLDGLDLPLPPRLTLTLTLTLTP